MDRSSLFKLSGLPDSFGVLLLAFSFILLLAPYFSGADFGLFKIPNFTQPAKKWLKIVGPLLFVGCLLSFAPLFPTKGRIGVTEGNSPSPSAPVNSPSSLNFSSTPALQSPQPLPSAQESPRSDETGRFNAAITGAREGFIMYQGKPLTSFIIGLYVANTGASEIVLNSVKFKIDGADDWNDQVVLHPQNEDIYSPNPFAFNIEANKSRSFEIHIITDKKADYFRNCRLRVGYVDSKAKSHSIDISNQ